MASLPCDVHDWQPLVVIDPSGRSSYGCSHCTARCDGCERCGGPAPEDTAQRIPEGDLLCEPCLLEIDALEYPEGP